MRDLADLPAQERIERIRADLWIDYPRAREALARLDELLLFPKRARMPNLLIFGASGMGKTMIIEKFARAHSPVLDPVSGIRIRPVIVVQMIPSPDEGRFYHRLLAVIGAPPPSRATLGQLETQVLRLLKEIDPRVLVIDEVQNLLAGTNREQRRMLNLLRFLGNELRIPAGVSGSARGARRHPGRRASQQPVRSPRPAVVALRRGLPGVDRQSVSRVAAAIAFRAWRGGFEADRRGHGRDHVRDFSPDHRSSVEAIGSGAERITAPAIFNRRMASPAPEAVL